MSEGTKGRFSCSEPNVQTLPRNVGAHPALGEPIFVHYIFPGYYLAASTPLQNGDSVVYDGRHEAKVIAMLPNGDVRIKFDAQNLIPPKMDVSIHRLERIQGKSKTRFVNVQVSCPKCDIPWKETPGFRFSFFDCPACGAKKEEHVQV